jgi:hypothetical protein
MPQAFSAIGLMLVLYAPCLRADERRGTVPALVSTVLPVGMAVASARIAADS